MSAHSQEVALLTILLATCETALNNFRAVDSPVDAELVADLEKMAARTRQELEALAP